MNDIADARFFCSSLTEGADQVMQILIDYLGVKTVRDGLITRSFNNSYTVPRWLEKKGFSYGEKTFSDALNRWEPRIRHFEKRGKSLEDVCEENECDFIYPGHPEWLTCMDDLAFDAPLGLWVKGRPRPRAVALVGCRAASDYGKGCAFDLARGMALEECSIISGGAYGIDTASHLGALHHGGHTTAVFANGFGHYYPRGNTALFEKILESEGCLLSETHPDAPATKWRFLQRNRLIAALAQQVVVVEAGYRSGARNTVNHAYNIDRPVGAVPGPINSPTSQGCFEVLKENPDNVCVTSVQDILMTIDPISTPTVRKVQQETFWSNSDELRVLDVLVNVGAADVSTIAQQSGLSKNSVKRALGILKTEGEVVPENGSWSKVEGKHR